MSEFLHVRRGVAAVVLAMSIASPAAAGGKALACYQQVHQPAVYKTIHQQVVVRPGGVVHETIPARYGQVTEKVLIEPERVVARHIPAVTKTVHQTVMVRAKSVGWEWRHVHGKKTLVQGGASGTICHAGPDGGGPARTDRSSADPGTLRAPHPYGSHRTGAHCCPARATGGQDCCPHGRSPARIRRMGSGLGQTPLQLIRLPPHT